MVKINLGLFTSSSESSLNSYTSAEDFFILNELLVSGSFVTTLFCLPRLVTTPPGMAAFRLRPRLALYEWSFSFNPEGKKTKMY